MKYGVDWNARKWFGHEERMSDEWLTKTESEVEEKKIISPYTR